MDCDVVEINCKCDFILFLLDFSNYNEYNWIWHEGSIVAFKLGGKNIRINFMDDFEENIHVGVIDCSMYRSKEFSDECREQARSFFSRHPTVPIIIACSETERKYRPGEMKKAELRGDELMNREIGDKLARELGAIKYIEYSLKTGRGVKILIDEIAFAGLGKMKDDEKRRNKRKGCVVT